MDSQKNFIKLSSTWLEKTSWIRTILFTKDLSKVLAKRMEQHLPKLIHTDQTEFISGRYIGHNIRLLSNIMELYRNIKRSSAWVSALPLLVYSCGGVVSPSDTLKPKLWRHTVTKWSRSKNFTIRRWYDHNNQQRGFPKITSPSHRLIRNGFRFKINKSKRKAGVQKYENPIKVLSTFLSYNQNNNVERNFRE